MRKELPHLADFLQDICKDDVGKLWMEPFGPVAMKKILECSYTIKAFNRVISEIEAPSTSKHQQSHFWGMYGISQGQLASYQPYCNVNYTNKKSKLRDSLEGRGSSFKAAS